MSFAVSADAYDRFMGRYSTRLSPQLADYAGVRSGQRVIDVGCGPGALTGELADRLGESNVSAIDPSESFVAAARERFPGIDVRLASAEKLPFPDNAFDAALAQLVVHFMSDPVAGLSEMARVVRKDGVVAACVWDQGHGNGTGQGPLSVFWRAAHELDPDVNNESQRAGARPGHLAELFAKAGPLCRRRDGAHRHHCSPEFRRVVGAVHPRRRSRRRLCIAARCRSPSRAHGTLSEAPAANALQGGGAGMDSTRPRVASERTVSIPIATVRRP